MKSGGPYTKKERENKINEVFRLHFEEGKTAVEIAEILKINRNTANHYIKDLYAQLAEEEENYDIGAWIVRLISSVESQKSRLRKELQKQNKLQNKLEIERFLSKLNDKEIEFIPKILENKRGNFESLGLDEISEEQIKKISRYLILDYDVQALDSVTRDKILAGIISFLKCTKEHAGKIFKKMLQLGLNVWDTIDPHIQIGRGLIFYYNFLKFAHMRGYISIAEYEKIQGQNSETELD